MTSQEKDFNWFLDNIDLLNQQYGTTYLVIKNGKILGSFESYAEGVKEACKTEQLGSFIVQKCGPDNSGYTVEIASKFV